MVEELTDDIIDDDDDVPVYADPSGKWSAYEDLIGGEG